jgi:hypothetical protein
MNLLADTTLDLRHDSPAGRGMHSPQPCLKGISP